MTRTRRTAALFVLTLVGGLMAAAGQANAATTHTVCASGCDFTSIQAAINAATPGDTVHVQAGLYTENVLTIDKALTLEGEDPGTVTSESLLTPGTLTSVVQTGGAGNGPTLTITGPASGNVAITVRALRFLGNDDFDTVRVSPTGAASIGLLSFDEVALSGSRAGLNPAGGNPTRGLSFTNSAVSCTGASNPTIGISPGFADGVGSSVHVDHNYVTACGYGINSGNFAGFGTASAVAGINSFDNNEIEEIQGSCILVAMSYQDLTIADNELRNCDLAPGIANGAIDLQGQSPATDVTVIGNVVSRAMPTSAGNVGIIVQNIPAGAGNLAHFRIEHNSVTGMTQSATSDGIRFGPTVIARAPNDVAIEVFGNVLSGNSRGGSWQTNAGTSIGQNLKINKNDLSGNVARGFSLFGSAPRSLNIALNWWGCAQGPQATQNVPPPCNSIGVANPGTATVISSPWISGYIDDPAHAGDVGFFPLVNTATTIDSDAPDPTVAGTPYTVDGTVEVTGLGGVTANLATLPGEVEVSDGTDDCTDTSLPDAGPLNEYSFSCGMTSTTPGAKTLSATYTDTSAEPFYAPSTGTASHDVEGTLRMRKQAVRDSLAAKQGSANAKDAKRIAKAIEHIDKSLDPALWGLDDAHLNTMKGQKVFEEEKKAVDELGKVEGTNVDDEILELVAIDRDLAQTATNEATPAQAAKAQAELDKGDADVVGGKYESAIEHYKKAWQYAVKT